MNNRPELYSFHKSVEGVEFLRRLYPIFRTITGYGEEKIGTLILHESGRLPQSEAAIERARNEARSVGKALTRWAANGQEHLYKSAKRRTQLLRRLEIEMMAVDDVRVILERQADSAEKRATAQALSTFFYGHGQHEARHPSVRVLRSSLLGLHQIVEPAYDDGSLGLGFLDLRSQGWYVYFHGTDQENHLWFHSFMLSIEGINDTEGEEKSRRFWANKPDYAPNAIQGFRFRRSGFAFVLPNEEIHFMSSDHGPPGRRYYNVWSEPSRGADQYRKRMRSGDRMFQYWEMPLDFGAYQGPNLQQAGSSRVMALRKPERMIQRRIEVLIERSKWSIIE
jgi:hypothetical protein